MKLKKIGMRTVKTALAVSLTILISQLFNLNSPFFAGIAAIMAMKTSVSESFSIGKNRMLGTIFGGIIALLFSYIAPMNVLSIGIGIVIIIYTCNMLGWKKSIQLSVIVFLSIILNYEEGSRLSYAFYRTLDTLIGLVIGTLINYFIVPPHPNKERFIKESITTMYSEFKNILETIIWEDENRSLEGLQIFLTETEDNYILLKKDTKLEIGKSHDYDEFELILESFKSIYNHLGVIFNMEEKHYLKENNRESLEKFLNIEIPKQDEKGFNELDVVFNYHVVKILEQLNFIEDIINDKEKRKNRLF